MQVFFVIGAIATVPLDCTRPSACFRLSPVRASQPVGPTIVCSRKRTAVFFSREEWGQVLRLTFRCYVLRHARPLRIEMENSLYQVTRRGWQRQGMVDSDRDREGKSKESGSQEPLLP